METYLIKQSEPMRTRRRYSSRPKTSTEENKKSFKVNTLNVNSNQPGSAVDDDMDGLEWTPEIPFGNVGFYYVLLQSLFLI